MFEAKQASTTVLASKIWPLHCFNRSKAIIILGAFPKNISWIVATDIVSVSLMAAVDANNIIIVVFHTLFSNILGTHLI